MGPSDFPPFGPLSSLRLATDAEVKQAVTFLFQLINSPGHNAWWHFNVSGDTWRPGVYYLRHVSYVQSYVEVKVNFSAHECVSRALRLCIQYKIPPTLILSLLTKWTPNISVSTQSSILPFLSNPRVSLIPKHWKFPFGPSFNSSSCTTKQSFPHCRITDAASPNITFRLSRYNSSLLIARHPLTYRRVYYSNSLFSTCERLDSFLVLASVAHTSSCLGCCNIWNQQHGHPSATEQCQTIGLFWHPAEGCILKRVEPTAESEAYWVCNC
jgi:hypothetical protein